MHRGKWRDGKVYFLKNQTADFYFSFISLSIQLHSCSGSQHIVLFSVLLCWHFQIMNGKSTKTTDALVAVRCRSRKPQSIEKHESIPQSDLSADPSVRHWLGH